MADLCMTCVVRLVILCCHFATSSINMSGLQCLATENIWFDKHRYDDAERCFYEGANGSPAQVCVMSLKTMRAGQGQK